MKTMLLIVSLCSLGSSAFAATPQRMMIVPNSDSGVKQCQEFLEGELNAKGKITQKDARGDTGALFFIDGKIVGEMFPSAENPDVCECETFGE